MPKQVKQNYLPKLLSKFNEEPKTFWNRLTLSEWKRVKERKVTMR